MYIMNPATENAMPPAPPAEEAPGNDQSNAATQHKLTQVVVENEVVALNLLVQFLGLAQRRGAFTIDEAAKIWECVKHFQKPTEAST